MDKARLHKIKMLSMRITSSIETRPHLADSIACRNAIALAKEIFELADDELSSKKEPNESK